MKKRKILPILYLVLIFVFLYLPLAFVVFFSFNDADSTARWTGFTFEWYGKMIKNRRMIAALMTSLKVAFFTSLFSAVIATLGAVSISRLPGWVGKTTKGLIFAPLIIPEIIFGIALLMIFSFLPMGYGVPTLVVAHSVFCVPYIFLMITIRLKTIDKSILEAARDLGAKRSTAFRTVTLPLILPAIISGTLLAFAMSLDDVVISFFLSSPKSMTLPIQIFSMLKLGISPEINALCTVILVVTFTIVGVIQVFNKYTSK